MGNNADKYSEYGALLDQQQEEVSLLANFGQQKTFRYIIEKSFFFCADIYIGHLCPAICGKEDEVWVRDFVQAVKTMKMLGLIIREHSGSD